MHRTSQSPYPTNKLTLPTRISEITLSKPLLSDTLTVDKIFTHCPSFKNLSCYQNFHMPILIYYFVWKKPSVCRIFLTTNFLFSIRRMNFWLSSIFLHMYLHPCHLLFFITVFSLNKNDQQIISHWPSPLICTCQLCR